MTYIMVVDIHGNRPVTGTADEDIVALVLHIGGLCARLGSIVSREESGWPLRTISPASSKTFGQIS